VPLEKGSKGLKAILDWVYSLPLTSSQQSVLLAHAHSCDYWNGRNSRPGLPLIAKKAKLTSTRRVQQIHRELQADPLCLDCRFTGSMRDEYGQVSRCPCHLLQRGPLVQEASANGPIPASYRLNLDLLPWAPVQLPITDPRLSTVSTNSTQGEIHSGEGVKFSPSNHEIFMGGTPKISHNKSEISDRAIRKTVVDRNYDRKRDPNTPAARLNYSPEDLQLWISIKAALRNHLPAAEWDLWVRPARLLRHMGGCLLIALPPADKILTAMVSRKKLVNQVAVTFGRHLLFTRYPDDCEVDKIKDRFGIDFSRKPVAGERNGPKSKQRGGSA